MAQWEGLNGDMTMTPKDIFDLTQPFNYLGIVHFNNDSSDPIPYTGIIQFAINEVNPDLTDNKLTALYNYRYVPHMGNSDVFWSIPYKSSKPYIDNTTIGYTNQKYWSLVVEWTK